MPINDKQLNDLVKIQTDLFNNNAPLSDKIDVLKKIQKCQKELMKNK